MKIPFNKPFTSGKEIDYIRDVIASGRISSNGVYTKKCQAWLETKLGCCRSILTHSCTGALEMAALLLDIQPGDEVIVPSFTYVSTVNSFVLRGARPVFIDIRPDTLNMDETQLERLITPRTKAIVPVHYAGVGCEMDRIMRIAQNQQISVIEDNAHGLLGKYKGRYLGTFGCLAAKSFHGTKNFTCGEGGALVVNDPQYVERAEISCEKGTDRNRFFKGQVDRYTWVDVGSSFLPSDILAAFLYAQLQDSKRIQGLRKRIWEYYAEHLREWAPEHGTRLPFIPDHCEHPYHLFYLVMPSLEKRDRLIGHLRENNIHSVFHYQPLHLSRMGKKFGGKEGSLPVTEHVSDRLLRLPFFNDLSRGDQEQVITAIKSFT
ncbi:MAG: dTDP-4-amino-4,6-dideoxygalactose transaminase [Thermodesulfobacteriota bacterium]|nr:dTDP-4-amino-4,6-dideoxygalactose transaminase [Thermodesulfobacteriota bacterium]